jgi:AcrR family transcriptional regulator
MNRTFNKTLARKERRRARDRDEVLNASARLFAENGFNETSMVEIAEASDFSVGKLYTLFANKEDLFVSLVSDRMHLINEASAAAVQPGSSPLDQLRERLQAALDYFVSDPHFSQIFLNEYPTVADGVLHQENLRHLHQVKGYLLRAMEIGQIPREDPEPLAAMITATLSCLIDLSEARGEAVTTAWILDYIERFYLRPLEARAARLQNPETPGDA